MDDSNPIDEVGSAKAFELVENVNVSGEVDAVDNSLVCITEETVYRVDKGDKDVRTVEGKLEVSVDLEPVTEDVSARHVVSSIIFVESVEEGEMNVDIEDEMVFVSISVALLLDCC